MILPAGHPKRDRWGGRRASSPTLSFTLSRTAPELRKISIAGSMFSHEKLQVYAKALDFAAKAAGWTTAWDNRHAFIEHLDRAAESILSNLAEAARQSEQKTD